MPRPLTLSVELLRTFVMVVRSEGDAMVVARELDINQPSMSKRLKALQTPGPLLARPWLRREGKTWHLTPEGEKVLPAVEELLQRYDRLLKFVEPERAQPTVSFGCGREFATTRALQAVKDFRKKYADPKENGQGKKPPAHLHITTLRGHQRIERVANGSLDLAVVLNDDVEIKEIARRRLYTKALTTDNLVLICSKKSQWSNQVEELPAKKVSAKKLVDSNLPFILPEADSSMRKVFEQTLYEKKILDELNISLEVGGWAIILDYVLNSMGVGIVTDGFLKNVKDSTKDLLVRPLDPKEFPALELKVIARLKNQQTNEADLTPEAMDFHDILVNIVKGG